MGFEEPPPEAQNDNVGIAPTPSAPIPSKGTKRLFLGPNGLRALWRFLIFVAIQIALQFLAGYLFLPRTNSAEQAFTARAVLVADALRFFSVVAATAIMAYFERRNLGAYGLPARGAFGLRFWEGALWGVAAQSVVMMTLYITRNLTFQGVDQRGPAAVYLGLMWGAAFLAVGLFEEFLFRGYPQFILGKGMGFWPAAFLLSGLFWLAHMANPGENWVGGLETALAALIFVTSLWLTGNLWFAVGMHAAWDWTETYLFGVADSGMPPVGHLLNTSLTGSKWMTGGTVGPEGSLVSLVVSVLVIALLFVRFGRRHERLDEQLHSPKAFKPAA